MSSRARKDHQVSNNSPPSRPGINRAEALPKVDGPTKVTPDQNKNPRVLKAGDFPPLKRGINRAKPLPKVDGPTKVTPDQNKTPRVPIPNTTSSSSDRKVDPGVCDFGPANLGLKGPGPMTSKLEEWGVR
ncbi:hypothetical protein BOTNAR_0619g00010 [Botryotinia narcissicola]|uniref:Uncharacterized protein n=1 Tax=Botryotinia narcissicola TaxID=278944 RepID=A0A4Z1HM61_9HELO|nr:hypothetical protein BOTNAR_0619g00010 [Botryotinia narcissicola]